MRKIFFTVLSIAVLASCKNQSEEVRSDETIIENPADTIATQDTVVMSDMALSDDHRLLAENLGSQKSDYASFGAKFTPKKVLSKSAMLQKYKTMKKGDTLKVQFASTIKAVCKKKGCWMSMALPNEKESFVRFKDYGFFVPLNADKSEAIVNGRAYIDVISVSQLQHYAKDGGKSQAEINKITKPEVTYAFQADGVMIKK